MKTIVLKLQPAKSLLGYRFWRAMPQTPAERTHWALEDGICSLPLQRARMCWSP